MINFEDQLQKLRILLRIPDRIFWPYDLESLTVIRHTENKINKRKQKVTCITFLYKQMKEKVSHSEES